MTAPGTHAARRRAAQLAARAAASRDQPVPERSLVGPQRRHRDRHRGPGRGVPRRLRDLAPRPQGVRGVHDRAVVHPADGHDRRLWRRHPHRRHRAADRGRRDAAGDRLAQHSHGIDHLRLHRCPPGGPPRRRRDDRGRALGRARPPPRRPHRASRPARGPGCGARPIDPAAGRRGRPGRRIGQGQARAPGPRPPRR